jgi:ribonuclease P protein component
MLPSDARLPYREFRALGRPRVETPYFSVRAKKNSFKKDRFGVVVSTHSLKSATRRNFWRRQAKSVFLSVSQKRQSVPQKNFDILVVFRFRNTLPQKNVFRKTLSDAIISIISRP